MMQLFPLPKMQNGDERTSLGGCGDNKARNYEETKKPIC